MQAVTVFRNGLVCVLFIFGNYARKYFNNLCLANLIGGINLHKIENKHKIGAITKDIFLLTIYHQKNRLVYLRLVM